MTRLFTNRENWKLAAPLLLVALSIPAYGDDGVARHSPESQPAASSELKKDTAAKPAENVTADAPVTPERPVPLPSLAQVMELLQAQAQELECVKEALRQQQELTARLAAKLNSIGAGNAVPETAAGPEDSHVVTELTAGPISSSAIAAPAGSPQSDLSQRVARLEADLGSSKKNLEDRLKSFGPFAFSGDFRLRAEPTFGGPVNQSQDLFRERIRLRFNAEARLNDQFKGGFSLASGDLNNPISTNETLGQYTTRKPIEIDRAYATYNPSWFRPLTLTGGKFAYPWFNTELVWDKDINPEGAGETLAFNVETTVLKKFSLVGFQLPFAETKRTAATNQSTYSTMMYGEQLQTFWELGSRVKLSAYTGFYDWKNADSIALAVATGDSTSPANGLLPLSSSNGPQNSIGTVTVTNAITGVKTISSAQFASKFSIVDSIAQFDIRTASERWPVTFIGDYAQNTRACENISRIPAAAVFSAPCDPRARRAYWLEASAGRLDRKGDWQFNYTRFVIEREAVIGAFNYSEIFPSNNVEMQRTEILYQLFSNITLQMNALFGRPLVNAGSPPPAQPLWERLQFDVTYKF